MLNRLFKKRDEFNYGKYQLKPLNGSIVDVVNAANEEKVTLAGQELVRLLMEQYGFHGCYVGELFVYAHERDLDNPFIASQTNREGDNISVPTNLLRQGPGMYVIRHGIVKDEPTLRFDKKSGHSGPIYEVVTEPYFIRKIDIFPKRDSRPQKHTTPEVEERLYSLDVFGYPADGYLHKHEDSCYLVIPDKDGEFARSFIGTALFTFGYTNVASEHSRANYCMDMYSGLRMGDFFAIGLRNRK